MRKPMAAIAGCLALFPGVANAAQPACLTKAEFSSLSAYALPSVISGTSKRCTQTLPASAYLPSSGQALVARYAARKSDSWPQAKTAFFKFGRSRGDKTVDMMAKMPDDSLREVVDVTIEGLVSQEIPLERCGTIDDAVRLLSPLPPENMAGLIGLIVSLAAKDTDEKPGKLSICRG